MRFLTVDVADRGETARAADETERAFGNVHVLCNNAGVSSPIPMDEATVVQWTQEMCEAGFLHDCEFDGWGTNAAQ